jgi:hypothetical protein
VSSDPQLSELLHGRAATATSTDPAAIVMLLVAHAVVLVELVGPDVVSTGDDVAIPVNDVRPIARPFTLVEYVAVIVVLLARPEGACAYAIAAAGFAVGCCACLAITHVRPPPETDESVAAAAHHAIDATMNPPAATVAVVLTAIVVAAASLTAVPAFALSIAMAIYGIAMFVPTGTDARALSRVAK